ncbi:MAG: hypothetical protein A2289_10325 [Deltaproteobacteria bacterium RIFOXYA12_FULL_58_15]|nr:MAG: hypothetical protein A2289_10325 [Deltaproteobacteria bacterium RIFOXYA12_FULL_58_15]OGR13156.1 MAG: hypothetical protein A2341_08645 [Deltaproteobacteria bacterium RIFOXYB12_FULL_58_9]
MVASMVLPRLRIVTGKGGVGKTVAATALAMAEARQGRRTLLAEVNGRDRVAALLGVKPVGAKMREVFDHLHIVDMNPRDAIREYALLRFRFEAVYNTVFENRLVRRFLRLIPSLGELVMLGKVWFHEQEKSDDGSPRFDVIIVDAPSTGHAKTMLRAPAVVERTVPPGPLRDITQNLQTLLTDHQRTQLHVVTTPEEMPVNEAIELEQAAVHTLGVGLGTTIINQYVEPLHRAALAAVVRANPESSLSQTLSIRDAKSRAGDAFLRRLPAYMLEGSVRLPRVVSREFGRTEIDAFVNLLAPAVVAETKT